jgi:hypothetical protein
MRLDHVYGTLAGFTDEELRAFIRADRVRRSRLERAADQVFMGWLVRAFDRSQLSEARAIASAAIREAGLPEPHPIRAVAAGLLPPLATFVAVFAMAITSGSLFIRGLPIPAADRAMLAEGWASLGLGTAALLAALVTHGALRAGPRDPADVFGERIFGALRTLYLVVAGLALLPVTFITAVMAVPDLAELTTIILSVVAVVLLVAGIRAGLQTRKLNGVWRPFEDAALAAVAHGHISAFEERLLTQPLEAAMQVTKVPAGELRATAT